MNVPPHRSVVVAAILEITKDTCTFHMDQTLQLNVLLFLLYTDLSSGKAQKPRYI